MPANIRIVILEDSEDDVLLVRALLERAGFSFELEHVDSAAGFEAALSRHPDLILSDWHIPGFGGGQALDILQQRGLPIPFIVLSGQIGEETATDAVLRGASDYVLKDRPQRLPQAILRALEKKKLTEDRNRAEEKLRLFQRAVEQSPVSVVITDTNGLIEYVNPKFLDVTGYTREELEGKTPAILKSGETPAEEYEHMWKTIRAGNEWQGVFHNRKKDGTIFYERATISPIRDDSGAISHFLGIKEDITAQRLLEQQLAQAQKMETVGRLAGGVAHDFNNQLTVINGFAELIMLSIDEANPIYEHLQQIRRAGASATQLTRQLLAFGRKQVSNPKPLDLNALLSGMMPMVRRLIGEHIAVNLHMEPGLRELFADATQVEQIVMNLAANSRDAMPDGGTITITTAACPAASLPKYLPADCLAGDHILFRFRDTGSGFSKEALDHLFEPFFTTKKDAAGNGLGLASIYGIVRQMKGWIEVKSSPNEGTEFLIYFPHRGIAAQMSPSKASRAKPAPSPAAAASILVVEDQDAVRNLLVQVLRRAGYTVMEASNGTDVMAQVDSIKAFDLLISDIVMPGISGVELVRQLRRTYPNLKCVLTSGYPPNGNELSDELERGTIFVPKPYAVRDFVEIVHRIVKELPKA